MEDHIHPTLGRYSRSSFSVKKNSLLLIDFQQAVVTEQFNEWAVRLFTSSISIKLWLPVFPQEALYLMLSLDMALLNSSTAFPSVDKNM